MSQRTLISGILSLALMLGLAAVADAQNRGDRGLHRGHDHAPGQYRQARNQGGPALTDVYFMVLDLGRGNDRIGDVRPGDTWTMAPGETLRFRTAGRAGGPERYPATRFRIVSGREFVKQEASNQEVGNVTITATQPTRGRDRTQVQYEIVDRGMNVQPRLRTGSFFIEVEGRGGNRPGPGGGVGDGVRRGMVIYEHQDFRGDREEFGEGEVRDLRFTRFAPDSASSIQLAPGCRVELFEHPDFQGRSTVLTRDETDLRRERMNDNLSSFVLDCGRGGGARPRPGAGRPGPGRDAGSVTIYEHQNFQGRSERFFEGEIADMNDTRLGGDVASSVQVDPGCRIVLFEHPRFDGQSTVLSRDEEDLRRHRMNDNLSSFRIDCR